MANEILLIIISLYLLILANNKEIKNNPIKTNIENNPLDFYISFNSYTAKTFGLGGPEGRDITIIEEKNQIKFDGYYYHYSSNIFRINGTNENNEYLFADNKVYSIRKDSNSDIISASIYKSIKNNYKYIGYLKQNNEIILYGINNNNIIFYNVEQESETEYVFNSEINTLSCKYLYNSKIICAFSQNNNLNVKILGWGPTYKSFNIDNIYHEKVILYNTYTYTENIHNQYIILCASDKIKYDVSCKIIKCDTPPNQSEIKIDIKNLDCETNFLKNEDNCYMIEFLSEFLLCCGTQDKIECQRRNIIFEKIEEFQINLSGNIYNLTMVNYNNNYVTLSYLNETSNDICVYEYYIYPPECQNISANITPFNEIEFILFKKKTNTKHNIIFNNLPFEFGISKINGIELNNAKEEIEIKDDEVIFSFISNNNYLPNNFDITYNISILETYSTECKISLSIKSCYKSCKNCSLYSDESNETNHNCIECNEEKGYYHFLDSKSSNCYKGEEISNLSENYYLDIENKVFRKCNSSCKTCNGSTDEDCLTCEDDKYLYNGKCLIYSPFNEIETTNNEIEEKEETIINIIETTIKGLESTIILNDEKQNKNTGNTIFNNSINSKDFKSQISNNITAFVNSSFLINGSDFLAVILNSDDLNPEEQLKLGISAIDLGNCTETIKDYYNISENDSLIILNMESKKNKSEKKENDDSFNLGKNAQIEVYDSLGNKLDLSVCKENIKIMKYIGDVEELDIESAMSLADQGVDVFNANDDFFNDICTNYDNTDGTDIVIKDRRTDIYQNASFCQSGCIYNGMNYDLMIANCLCDSSYLQISLDSNNTNNEENIKENLNFNTIAESFLSNLLDFNIDVIYCYNLLFNLEILKTNIGFISMIIMLILQIIFFFIYLVKKLEPIKYFMLIFKNKNSQFAHSFPPKKDKNNSFKGKSIKKKNNNISNKINNIKNKSNSKNAKVKTRNKNLINDMNTNSEEETKNANNVSSIRKLQLIDNESENEFSNENKNSFDSPKSKINNNKDKGTFILNNNFSPNINIKNPIINIKNAQILSVSDKTNINNKIELKEKLNPKNNKLQNIKPNIKNNKILKNKNILKNNVLNLIQKNLKNKNKALYSQETIGEKNNVKYKKFKNNQEIMKLSRNDEDLLEMDYEQSIIFDKRTYIRMYWALLVDTQKILGTFCTENYLYLFIIKLSFLVFTFQISFFLNAFFYTDEYISSAYHNDGVLDFFSGLPKSIYSFIATIIITNLLSMLSNSKGELIRVIKNKRNNDNYTHIIDIKLKKLRVKLIFYFTFVFILSIIFLYYVSVFCAVYRYSQKYWFIGCLESFGLDTLVAIVSCIFIALFRYIAIKNHIKCLYIFANIIRIFI